MQKDEILRRVRDPRLIPLKTQTLLLRVAALAAELRVPCYLVGGVVRDLLLERPVHESDIDFVFEGDAIEFGYQLVKACGGKLTAHQKFRTAVWHTPEDGDLAPDAVDLITARSEVYKRPGALPTVTPATLMDDLRRRDFPVNAMAIRLDGDDSGELIDPLNGQGDLARKLIRVLHPASFLDDPTRIFRALRYVARYGFTLEAETLRLINAEARAGLAQLSGERLRHEFDVTFEETNPSATLQQFADFGLLEAIHPALLTAQCSFLPLETPSTHFGEFTVPEILSVRQSLGWIFYLIELNESDSAALAKRLAFPVALAEAVRFASILKRTLPSLKDYSPSQWTFYLDEAPPLSIYAVYLASRENALSEYLSKWRRVKPIATGADLKTRGLRPGPHFGEILRRLRAAWLDEIVVNQEQEDRWLDSALNAQK